MTHRSHSTVSGAAVTGIHPRFAPKEGVIKETSAEELKDSLMGKINTSPSSPKGNNQMLEIERGGCCFNTSEMFNYNAPTQEQLRMFLFSTSERYSTFIAKEEKKVNK